MEHAGLAAQLFVLSNLALILAYLAMPVGVIPYLSFRRRTKYAWMVFFVGCVFSHSLMAWVTLSTGTVHHVTSPAFEWVIAVGHTAQAVGSWAAVIWARGDLERADAFLVSLRTGLARGAHGQ